MKAPCVCVALWTFANYEVFPSVSCGMLIGCTKCIVAQCSGSVVRTVPAAPISVDERILGSGSSWLPPNARVAIAAIVAGFLLSPSFGFAGCGDYVLIRDGHGLMARGMPDHATDQSSADPANHRPPHRPCQGPGCSDGSGPPQAPTPTTTTSIDRWILTPSDTLQNPIPCSNVLVEPLRIVDDGFHLSILRPPR